MKIISETTLKQATEITSNAKYIIEYTLSNNAISRVMVSIYMLEKDDANNDVYVGTISYENEVINSSLPLKSNTTALMEDFNKILLNIKAIEFPNNEKNK